MNKEIIDKYGIKFQNRVRDGKISKFPYASFGPLTFLLVEWNVADINDNDNGLLADIDTALADPYSEIEAGSTAVHIIIYQNIVQFYFDNQAEVPSMPTKDLREIVVAWRDFLLLSPLNGTRASIFQLAKSKLKRFFN